MLRMLCLVAVFAVVGCGESKKDGEGADKGASASLDAGKQYILESAQGDLKEISDKLAKGEVPSTLDCAGYKTATKQLAGIDNADVKTYLAAAKKACTYDVPVAIVKDWQKKISAGAGSTPNSGCFDAANVQLKELKASHPDDAGVKGLIEAVTKACPNVKL